MEGSVEYHVSDCSCGPFNLMRCLPPIIIQLGAEGEGEGEGEGRAGGGRERMLRYKENWRQKKAKKKRGEEKKRLVEDGEK